MKLEIDIPSIIYNDAKENRGYISVGKMEIAWKSIADGKPLEQEPCEDAVSRQAVLEYIEGSEAELGHSSENELVCQDIKELPPVTPQERKGHWEYGYAFPDGNYCKCSECKELIKCIYPMHYCPNCGADMREVEECKD